CPLNQNGEPAASLTPATFCPVGVISGSAASPFGGRSAVWNAVGTNFTESPMRIVTPCGKKSLTSEPYLWLNVFCDFVGRPMATVLVAACAATGSTSIMPAAAASTAILVRTVSKLLSFG